MVNIPYSQQDMSNSKSEYRFLLFDQVEDKLRRNDTLRGQGSEPSWMTQMPECPGRAERREACRLTPGRACKTRPIRSGRQGRDGLARKRLTVT